MTREEEIKKAVQEFIEERKTAIGRSKRGGWYFANIFEEGIKWADEHPKSSWINVKDDLPCNHEELISNEDKRNTFYVIALVHSFVCLSRMEKFEGKWNWSSDEPTYWFPIPELPKE